MLYHFSQNQHYSPSFHVYAVVAGVFLLRGNLRAVWVITWAAAFISSLISTQLIVLPLLKPAELWLTEFHLDPISFSSSLIIQIATLAFLGWIYTQLRTESVVSATVRGGYSVATPKLAFVLGVTIVIVLAGIIHFTLGGEAGAKALTMAQAQYGEAYNYHVTAIRWEGGQVRANLFAYNEHEIKPVQVEWSQ